MAEEPKAHTPESRAAEYKEALTEELRGAKARAAAPGLDPLKREIYDAYVKDVEAELARVSKPVVVAK